MPCTIANPCEVANVTGFYSMFDYANRITGQTFGITLVFISFLIVLIGFVVRGYPIKQSLPASFFITWILSLVLRAGNLIVDGVVAIFLIGAVISAILMSLSKD